MIHDKSDLNAIINNELVSDRYYLFNMFGLTNDWFYKPKEFDELDEDIYNEVRDSCFEIAYQGFKRGLDYLSRKGKIVLHRKNKGLNKSPFLFIITGEKNYEPFSQLLYQTAIG